MKELTIEQKAQRYDEALGRAKEIHAEERAQPFDVMLKVFPELKESEDERIRKGIIDFLWKEKIFLQEAHSSVENNPKYRFVMDAIAWLEKQAEHANFRNKIQIGDKVTRNEDGVLVNLSQLNRVAKKQTEQKLYVNDNAKEMFIKALERVEEQNNKGYKLTDCDKNSWWEDFKAYTSCTVEQKPAWSEEDEEIHRKCICAMRASACGFPEEEKFVEQVDNWLKSLKDRYTWKPSDEQMDNK